MPFTYAIDPAERIATVTFGEGAGVSTGFEAMEAISADPLFAADFGLLIDLRAARMIPTGEEVRSIVSKSSRPEMFASNPTAPVVSQVVMYGMANMVSILAGLRGATVKPFYEYEEALAWLRTHVAHGSAP